MGVSCEKGGGAPPGPRGNLIDGANGAGGRAPDQSDLLRCGARVVQWRAVAGCSGLSDNPSLPCTPESKHCAFPRALPLAFLLTVHHALSAILTVRRRPFSFRPPFLSCARRRQRCPPCLCPALRCRPRERSRRPLGLSGGHCFCTQRRSARFLPASCGANSPSTCADMFGFKLEATRREGGPSEKTRPIYLDMQVRPH